MAENADAKTEEEEKKPSGSTSLVTWILVAVVSVASGFAIPLFLGGSSASETDKEPATVASTDELQTFVKFGDVTANLNAANLNRYLKFSIELQVNKSDELEIQTVVDENETILKSWLLSHISDKTVEDIRGANGQNRLRREIQNQFNFILFPDGMQKIRHILFTNFNIQ